MKIAVVPNDIRARTLRRRRCGRCPWKYDKSFSRKCSGRMRYTRNRKATRRCRCLTTFDSVCVFANVRMCDCVCNSNEYYDYGYCAHCGMRKMRLHNCNHTVLCTYTCLAISWMRCGQLASRCRRSRCRCQQHVFDTCPNATLHLFLNDARNVRVCVLVAVAHSTTGPDMCGMLRRDHFGEHVQHVRRTRD